MKGNEQKLNSLLRLSNLFLFAYLTIFTFSLVGAFTLPDESKIKDVSFAMMYVVGLPLVIGTLMWALAKLGILTDGKEKKK